MLDSKRGLILNISCFDLLVNNLLPSCRRFCFRLTARSALESSEVGIIIAFRVLGSRKISMSFDCVVHFACILL